MDVVGGLELRHQRLLAPLKVQCFVHLPGTEGIVTSHSCRETELAVTPEAPAPASEELPFPFLRIKRHEQVYRAVEHREDAAVVRGALFRQHLQVFDRGAERTVIEIVHRAGRVGADLHCRFRDHAELAVAQQRLLEQLGILLFRALLDLSGRSHDLERHGLVGAAAVLRGIHVDAADSQRPADGGRKIQGRRKIIESLPAERFRQRMPVDAGFGADGQILLIDRKHPAHPVHCDEEAAECDGLAVGG